MVPFFQYADHSDDRICEWIAGAIEILPPLSEAQIRLRDLLLNEVGAFIESNEMGLLIAAPFAIRLPEEMQRAREPDLLFMSNQFAEAMQSNYVDSHGVALVIEITDRRTRQQDYGQKLADYQMAGIPEYWIIDVDRQQADFYRLHDMEYEHALPSADIYTSPVLRGYTLSVANLYS